MGVVYGKRNSETGKIERFFVITDGLTLYLDAGDTASYPGSGTTWFDISGNGNDGTINGGATFDSANGGSIVFDGSDDSVTVSNVQPGTNDFTITVWVLKDSTGPNQYIYDFGSNGGTLTAGTSVSGYGFRYYNPTLGVSSNVYTQGTVPVADRWYDVTMTRSGTTTSMYVDGQFVTSSSGDSYNISSTTLNIGKYGGNNSYNHDGKIANFRIYNRALTSSEIQTNFSALRSRFGI